MSYGKKKSLLSFFFTSFLLIGMSCANAQDKPYIKGNFNINGAIMISATESLANQHVLRHNYAEIMYGFNNWIEAGLHLSCHTYHNVYTDDGYEEYFPKHFQYGFASKAHLLPAVVRPSFYVADVYAFLNAGLIATYDDGDPYTNVKTSFCKTAFVETGLGAGVNIVRYFGVFYEFSISTYDFMRHRVGVNIRFPGPKKWTEKLK